MNGDTCAEVGKVLVNSKKGIHGRFNRCLTGYLNRVNLPTRSSSSGNEIPMDTVVVTGVREHWSGEPVESGRPNVGEGGWRCSSFPVSTGVLSGSPSGRGGRRGMYREGPMGDPLHLLSSRFLSGRPLGVPVQGECRLQNRHSSRQRR